MGAATRHGRRACKWFRGGPDLRRLAWRVGGALCTGLSRRAGVGLEAGRPRVKRFRRKERSRGNVRCPLLGCPNRNMPAAKRAMKWREANREAIVAYNQFVDKHGTFSNDVRS